MLVKNSPNSNLNISHKIELVPNNKAKTHFRKAFGCARLAYNWGLAKWQEYYKAGVKRSYLELKKEFNALKKEQFPFVYEVSKYATQQPFLNLNLAFNKFFKDLNSGKVNYPKFKKKRENFGSFYIGGDQVAVKERRLKVPNFGYVKMREALRFNGKINSVTISQNGEKFYASFSFEISQNEFEKTHKKATNSNLALGIDVGIKSFLSLSNGLQVKAPKPLGKLNRLLVKRARQLAKKAHPRTKDEARIGVKKSSNYQKASVKLNKLHRRISNIRSDFLHKLTSALVRKADFFTLENLNVKGMMKNHKLANSLSDVSLFEFRRELEYKAAYNGKAVFEVDRFYPSSKTCSCCGFVKSNLTLSDRIYVCEACGMKLDRDYNASLNLLSQLTQKVGQVLPEWTPVDLTAMVSELMTNQILTSKAKAGIQQKSYSL